MSTQALEERLDAIRAAGGFRAAAIDHLRTYLQSAPDEELFRASPLFDRGADSALQRVELLAKLGAYGVSPFQVSPEDLEQDLENARRASRRR